jgi:hypothetical protein
MPRRREKIAIPENRQPGAGNSFFSRRNLIHQMYCNVGLFVNFYAEFSSAKGEKLSWIQFS